MIRKCIWEESDIKCGMYVICETSPEHSGDIAFMSSVSFKVGYQGSGSRPCLIAMTDGLVSSECESKDAMVQLLNRGNGYRPMTHYEMTMLIKHQFSD